MNKKDEYTTVELEIDDSDLLRYMIAAHEKDVSFNEYVRCVLLEFLKDEEE